MNRLKEKFNTEVTENLMKKFNYSSVMEVPKIDKIVVNMGVGDAVQNSKVLDNAVEELELITGQKPLVTKAKNVADQIGATTHVGNVLSSDTFYNADPTFNDAWKKMGILGIEMESAGLYLNAIHAGKKALGIFTVSDHILRDEATTPEERQNSFTQMMEIALEIAE